ncbi:hypothetical protein [Owenweeksia hongkongensis]|uniref:hypothetical protein n=1 Tax=Owenweeksia hongkongensis TaxID=253245 RepID=UPI003A955E1E
MSNYTSDKLNRFLEEHKADIQNEKFIELFSVHAGETLGIARDLFEEFDPPNKDLPGIKGLLLKVYENFIDKRCFGDNRYLHINYYWFDSTKFNIPGYFTTDKEVIDHYIEIVAANFKATWFKDGQFIFTNVSRHKLQWDRVWGSKLECFYDQPGITEKDWQNLFNIIEGFEDSPAYGNFIDGFRNIHKQLSVWGDKPSNYKPHLDEWFKIFSEKLPFPINRFNPIAEIKKAVESTLDKLNLDLIEKQRESNDGKDILINYLKSQKKIISTNPEYYSVLLIKSLSKLEPANFVKPISLHRFEETIRLRVAASFINEHEEEANSDHQKIIAYSKNITVADLAIIGQAMIAHGLFEKQTHAYTFLHNNFKIPKEKSLSYYSPTPNFLINKVWKNISNYTEALKKWRSLRNKIEEISKS